MSESVRDPPHKPRRGSEAGDGRVWLSVVLPCHNGGATIWEQLHALAGQAWSRRWELVVVDNRSTDDSRAIIESFAGRMANLRVIDAHQRLGVGYARNVGARQAAADRIAFCDADDQVVPGWVAAMGDALAEHPFLVGTLETHQLNAPWVRASRRHPKMQGPQNAFGFLPHAGVGNMGMRRFVFESVGGFDESLPCQEDTDFCWKVQLKGIPLHHLPEAIVHYRFRDSMRGIYRQAYGYGLASMMLYRRYHDEGMPNPRSAWGLKRWAKVALLTPLAISRPERARWLWHIGTQLGYLAGSAALRAGRTMGQPAPGAQARSRLSA